MATGVFSNSVQKVDRLTRIMPVIPVVPRKFEKKLTQTISSGEPSGEARRASSQTDRHSLKEWGASLVKSESLDNIKVKGEGDLEGEG